MKNALILWCLAALLLSSCSLMKRSAERPEYDPNRPPFDPSETADTLAILATTPGSWESEISRLNTKISALETKVDVLTANMERMHFQRSQPVIEARPAAPQLNMAAPVGELPEEALETSHISASPMRPGSLPGNVKGESGAVTGAEREFRAAMELFQGGRNLEAASRFALSRKESPQASFSLTFPVLGR
jgi:hypothetical protein